VTIIGKVYGSQGCVCLGQAHIGPCTQMGTGLVFPGQIISSLCVVFGVGFWMIVFVFPAGHLFTKTKKSPHAPWLWDRGVLDLPGAASLWKQPSSVCILCYFRWSPEQGKSSLRLRSHFTLLRTTVNGLRFESTILHSAQGRHVCKGRMSAKI
jgi:hypothetical protein